jgi:hypothetical protein
MTPSSSGAIEVPDQHSGLRLVRCINRGGAEHSDLGASATAVDDDPSQNNEKHNRGGDRPPVIFAPPWVGPPAVVTARRTTSVFKV